MLDLPEVSSDTYFVPSDIECDPRGNIYISSNSPFIGTNSVFAHQILFVENNGLVPWPGQQDMVVLAEASITGADKGFRALAYDGVSRVDAGGASQAPFDMAAGNRLYVDVDFALASDNPDELVGLTTVDDWDSDMVPDGLDNCWQTSNFDQRDADSDGMGDLCEGDCDGDGRVSEYDVQCLVEYGDTDCSGPGICAQDLDGDGDADGSDLSVFATNLASAP
jgi:hypothetical protein